MIKKSAKWLGISVLITTLPACQNTNDSGQPSNDLGVTELQFMSTWPEVESAIAQDPVIESEIQSILSQMSLEEKVGQMIQPNLDDVTPIEAKEYKLGSLLNGGGSWPNQNKRSTAEDWAATADSYWMALDEAYQDRGFKIPFMWATDAVHGHNNVFSATVFPHNIGLGAANDPDLIYRIGQTTAREVAATGLDWTFAPTVAVPRDYRWGRVYEGYSEDPAIVFSYAGKMVDGLQGGSAGLKTDQHVISNVKHWVGDGGTLKGTDRGETYYSEEAMINLHAAGYFSGLDAGAQVVMSSFNSWHNEANYDQSGTGEYNQKVHGSKYLITDVLKEQMGFDGIVITDWNGQSEINDCTASNCPAAVNAGNDIFMVTSNADWKAFYSNVIEQVEDGTISQSRIDDAVTRILRVKMRANLWEKPMPSSRSLAGDQTLLGASEHRAIAREAVSKSLVLLKNKNNTLPLASDQKVLLAGSAADNLAKQHGGWSLTWQGDGNTIEDFPGASTLKMALEAQIGAENVLTDISEADENTVAVVAIGEDPYAEYNGDIKDHQTMEFAALKTSYAADLATVKELKEAGMTVVTIFFSGRPMYVNEEINNSDAFIAAWLPGTEGGGITDVLYSVDGTDFTGRLSYSWPGKACSTTINRVPVNMPNYVIPEFEQDIGGEHAPLFPYGYGLSYGSTSEGAIDSLDTDNLELDVRDYGCAKEEPDTELATTPFEVFGTASGGEFVMRISGANNNWVGLPVPPAANSVEQGDVTATPFNYQSQYDAVSVAFDGGGAAQVYLQFPDEQGQDFSSYLNADSTLQFDIRMQQMPTKDLRLATHCVYPCVGELDFGSSLPAVSDSWSTLKVPLQCFAEQGMSFSSLNTAFLFFTEGEMQFDLGNVRIVPESVDPALDALACGG